PHIDGLSSTIEALELTLRNLLKERSDAQRTLNSFIDPIARLPPELRVDIFLLCMPESGDSKPDPNAPPMVFLNVCRLWRDIALAIPKLWARLRIDSLPCSDKFGPGELCNTWIQRACGIPLSLTLHGKLVVNRTMRDLVSQYSAHLRHLTLKPKALTALTVTIQFGREIEFDESVQFPALETLAVLSESTLQLCLDDCIRLLRAAPALVECELGNMHHTDRLRMTDPLIHASLQRLLGGEDENSALILKHLTLPALRVLCITTFDVSTLDLTAFLTRSSPPLTSLSINCSSRLPDWAEQITAGCFEHIPSLTSLTLAGASCFAVLSRLIQSPDILPNLRHLVIHIGSGFSTQECEPNRRILPRTVRGVRDPGKRTLPDNIVPIRRPRRISSVLSETHAGDTVVVLTIPYT
ncbi:F-box domain-containing protein, partial [Favolaschia claudopus]